MVRNSRGFTLIELLLVIAIIGILMSLAMANYHYARLQAAAARLYGLDAEAFAHVLSTFPLVDEDVREASMDAFTRTV